MCGIAGFIDFSRSTTEPDGIAALVRMTDRIAHRGPDDAGTWCDASHGAFLAHRRLSIVDLSAAGHQPMPSGSGRYVIVYNGEIYNHRALRAELDALAPLAWRGHSDTEVILAAFERWGIEQTLPKLIGMFAIAVWDRVDRALTLVRDRAGEKPLACGMLGGKLVFASELKAFEGLDASKLRTNQAALPAAAALRLHPGAAQHLRRHRQADAGHVGLLHATRCAHVARRVLVGSGLGGRRRAPPADLVAGAVHRRARATVDRRGAHAARGRRAGRAFLSGGIDSSTVVALAQKCLSSKVRTFSIGFDDQAFDESVHARRVADHLGTDHTELRVTSQDALDQVGAMATIYDEPSPIRRRSRPTCSPS